MNHNYVSNYSHHGYITLRVFTTTMEAEVRASPIVTGTVGAAHRVCQMNFLPSYQSHGR